MDTRFSRRDALRSGVAGALGAASAEVAQKRTITIGMATTEFRKHTNAQLANELRGQGIRVSSSSSPRWTAGIGATTAAATSSG